MRHQIPLILDKSTLQALNPREAEWLFHHFRVNLPPVFFSELLGDLHKADGRKTSTGTGIGDARALAAKIDAAFLDLNLPTYRIYGDELRGRSVPLDGRAVVGAEFQTMPDGTLGAFIDHTHTQNIVQRWKAGDFDAVERAYSRLWRRRIARVDLEGFLRDAKPIRDKSIALLADVARLTDAVLRAPNQNHANLMRWLGLLRVQPKQRKLIAARWKALGRPAAIEFVPYTAYLARLEVFFLVGVANEVITTRSTNRVDLEYFEYLPFCKVFSSGDKIHAQLFPHFARDDQVFISSGEIKSALREMADHYEALPAEEIQKGTFQYAAVPPVMMDNVITRAFDKILPSWREQANYVPKARNPEKEAALLKRLQANMAVFKRR